MRAVVLPAVGASLEVEEIPVPAPRAGEVLIRVRACGVCHTDLHVVKGEVKFPLPAVLGHEVSGSVEETGPGVTEVARGARVVASFIMPCNRCRFCAAGRDDMPEILALAAAGRISVTQPISRRYRLDQADEAYRTLDRGEITGRAIVVM
jgi:Zn-dependent alcohol dehydrogenase